MRLHTLDPVHYTESARYQFLSTVEDDLSFAYVDSKGIATIGIGLNLREHGRLVLEALGFDLAGNELTGDALIEAVHK